MSLSSVRGVRRGSSGARRHNLNGCLTSTPAGRNAQIVLKNSAIERPRESRFRARRVMSTDSPYARACGRIARGKTGWSAEPLWNFLSRLPAVS